jgi:hypothetical protein
LISVGSMVQIHPDPPLTKLEREGGAEVVEQEGVTGP